MLSENDFDAVLATFCCYGYGANASEAVRKIATHKKNYRKWSSYVIVCWIAKIYQPITVKKGCLFTYEDNYGVAKNVAEVSKKKNQ